MIGRAKVRREEKENSYVILIFSSLQSPQTQPLQTTDVKKFLKDVSIYPWLNTLENSIYYHEAEKKYIFKNILC